MVVSGGISWNFVVVKTLSPKSTGRLTAAVAADADVRQLQATGKRVAADRKLALRMFVATGMYTATGRLKPRFR